jgi:hypothetical protein
LLGYRNGVINLDAEVSYGALDLGVTEEQLDRPQISGASISVALVRRSEYVP